MSQEKRIYIAIDLKSFYASAECVDRGLDPLTTNLVVADASRTPKTICLAVSPSLKAYGIPGRPRLFEVVQKVKEVNRARERQLRAHFSGEKSLSEIRDSAPASGTKQDKSGAAQGKSAHFSGEKSLPEIRDSASASGDKQDKSGAAQGKSAHFSGEKTLPEIRDSAPASGTKQDKSGAARPLPPVKSRTPQTGKELLAVMETDHPVNDKKTSQSLFSGSSVLAEELSANPALEADYIIAVPRMAHYIEYSARIYEIYLRYIAPEDIHVYSIDEVMMDVTKYLPLYKKTAHELAMEMIRAVLKETGITATAGIGPNLYLCKIAMDIEAKHTPPDADGVRIAELDEMSYRRKLWGHRPITDFWRVGRGTAKKLARYGMFTMGDIARYSLKDEDLLYKMFGINAELLIDHAWGWEPCTIDFIKAYKPENRSFSAGQVLQYAYDYKKARIVVQEMADGSALDLVEKHLVTDQMVLTVVYDNENLTNPEIRKKYTGPVKEDHYGRSAPKPAHGTANLGRHTSSSRLITDAVLGLYDRIVNPDLLIRKIYLATNHVIEEQPKKTAAERQAAAGRYSEETHAPGYAFPRNNHFKNEKNDFGDSFTANDSLTAHSSGIDHSSGIEEGFGIEEDFGIEESFGTNNYHPAGNRYEFRAGSNSKSRHTPGETSLSGNSYESRAGSNSKSRHTPGEISLSGNSHESRAGFDSENSRGFAPEQPPGHWEQLDLFTDYEALEQERKREQAALEKERKLQEAMLSIRKKYGKNAILKGTSLQDGATMRERNQSIGGHKA